MKNNNGDACPPRGPKSGNLKSPSEGPLNSNPHDCNTKDLAEGHPQDIDFSRPFRGFDWSDHVRVQRMIDEVFAEYAVWYREDTPGERIKNPHLIRQYLTHFLLEAFRVHRAQPGMMLGVPLGKDRYRKTGDRYRRKHIASYDGVKNVTDFLVAGDYLEMPFGKAEKEADPKRRKTTRFRATDRLIRLCEDCGVNPFMIRPYVDSEVIILRKPKAPGQMHGDLMEYDDTEFTNETRMNLNKINAFIAEHHIDLDIFDDQEQELLRLLRNQDDPAKDKFLDFTRTRLSRIFNNASFEQGGRFFHGWWMSVPGDFRSLITIDGEQTVELDYSGMHFAIMYADLGMDIPMDDPYVLDGYGGHLRGHIKKAFNIIINCDSRDEAIGALNRRIRKGELSEELGDGRRLLAAFAEAHPLIRHKIASGEGIRGQFKESRIAEKVMLRGMETGMCILPMHDGFITKKQDADTLEDLMNEAFREITGRSARIKPETFDLSVLPHAGEYETYFIRRTDGSVELNGPLEGKAISFSPLHPELPAGRAYSKKNKEKRAREWEEAHGK